MNAQTTFTACTALLSATVDRKALSDALAMMKTTGARVIEKRNTIPILHCVLIEATRDMLTIHGTDLDIMLTVEAPADVEAIGRVAVEFEALDKALKAAKSDTVRLSDMGGADDKKAGRLMLQHGAGTAQVPTRLPDDFPMLKAPDALDRFSIDGDTLKLDLDRLAPCISTEETRYYLNGVFMHRTKDEYGADVMRLAATDGHKLGRVTRPVPEGMGEDFADVIIPRKAVELLRRKACKSASIGFRFAGRRGAFSATFGRCRIVSKLVDGTFPDYSRVIPSAGGHVIGLPADTLADAAKAVAAHMDRKGGAIYLSGGAGWATSYAVCPDNGTSFAMLDGSSFAGKDGADEFGIGFNSQYVSALMSEGFKGQTVTIDAQDWNAPARIDCEATPEFIAVMMPMRTDFTPKSPEALRKMNRDALEIFAEEMPGELAKVARTLEVTGDRGTFTAKEARKARTLARRNAGAMISAAIDLLASRTGSRVAARADILARVAEMQGAPSPVEARIARAKARGGHSVAIDLPTAATVAEPAPIEPAQEPEAVETAPVVDVQPEPAPVTQEPASDGEPMFSTLQDFKAMAGQGSRWVIETWDPRGGWTSERVRTVATVRARDIGFLSGDATLDECRKADVKGHGGRSWFGFPKQDDWTSDADGLVIYYMACGQAGRASKELPCLRLRPAPVEAAPEPVAVDAPAIGQPDELASLREMVLALSAKVAALEEARMPVEAQSDDVAASPPVAAPVEAPRRTVGHARAIRMAMRFRQQAKRHAANRDRLESEVRAERAANRNLIDSIEIAQQQERAAVERATVAEEAVETAHKRIGALEGMLGKATRRIKRLAAVLTGRNAQIETLGRDLIIARNRSQASVDRPAATSRPERVMEGAA